MRPRLLPSLAGAAAVTLAALPAAANGVFPNAGQIVIDPSDPQHVVVRTTYGVLTTRAGGEPWDWICESAVGYGSGFHPAVALTADGTLIAGLPDGLAVAHGDTCAWSKTPGELDGAFVVDVSVEKSDPSRAVLVTSKGASGAGDFWTSDDDAVTWTKTGNPLPAGFVPLAIDVAPSDPMRVYVTALVGGAGSKKGTLFVSDDRGATWSQFTVPSTDIDHAPYIGGVDPADPDRLFVRNDGTPGRLFVFDRAAGTFTQVFTGQGILRGFALSPDGATVLVGGSSDGIWRAPAATLAFEKVSSVATRCLTWAAAGVYSCATEFAEGFTIGLSKDEGATFEPIMHLPCVRGPLECGAGTSVDTACPSEWPAVALQIGKEDCPDETPTGAGGSGGSTGNNGGNSGTGATGGAGGNGGAAGAGAASQGGAGAGASETDPASGCACTLAPGSDDGRTSRGSRPREHDRDRRAGMIALGVLALLVFRRGRRRATPSRMNLGSSRRPLAVLGLAASLVAALALSACDEKPSPDRPAGATAAVTATAVPTATATATATAAPADVTAAPTAEPGAAVTAEPAPSAAPSATASAAASATPSAKPTAAASAKPTATAAKPKATAAASAPATTAAPTATAAASAPSAAPAATAAELAPPAEGSAEAVAHKLDAIFSPSKKNFSAKFKQRLEQKVTGQKKESTGLLHIERPNKISFRYDPPNKNRIVSDGTTLKAYVAEDSQMFESKVGSSAYAGGLAFFMGGLRKTMTFTFNDKADFKDGYVLVGKPRTPSPTYEFVMFYVDKTLLEKGDPGAIVRIVIVDAQGNKNRFDFTEATFPASVPASEWEFTPPPGTNITKN